MIHTELFKKVLINPIIEHGADNLKIITGYASPAMLAYHIDEIVLLNPFVNIELIVGMTVAEGITEVAHAGFIKMMNYGYKNVEIKCSYICKQPAVHSKVYLWERDDDPIKAFFGSANYSQGAFVRKATREIMGICNPVEALEYFYSLDSDKMYCTHPDIEDNILINKIKKSGLNTALNNKKGSMVDIPTTTGVLPATHIKISLLDKNGKAPERSGLNWGQREGREHNQAYIGIPTDIMKTGFFPNRGEQFTVLTDDGKSIICGTAQSSKKGDPPNVYKAIHSPTNNSLLGEYFRYRLGLSSGSFVHTADIKKYGRTDVSFYKLDDETYYMDFSV